MNLFEKFINLCKKVWNSVVEFFKTVWAKVNPLLSKYKWMKPTIIGALVAIIALIITLICLPKGDGNENSDSSSENSSSSEVVKPTKYNVGLGYNASWNGTNQLDLTTAFAAFGEDGKVYDVRFDVVQVKVAANDENTGLKLTNTNIVDGSVTTKCELGLDYNMVPFGGAVAEVDEQIEAFADYCKGKTVEEVIESTVRPGHGESVCDELEGQVTITVDAFEAALKYAYEHKTTETYELTGTAGVAMVSGLAYNYGNPQTDISVDVAGVIAKDGVVEAALIDAIVYPLSVAADGTITADVDDYYLTSVENEDGTTTNVLHSKKDLGDAYAMAERNDGQEGCELEWYEQAAIIEKAAIGKTADAISTLVKNEGDLTGATITLNSYVAALAKATNYAGKDLIAHAETNIGLGYSASWNGTSQLDLTTAFAAFYEDGTIYDVRFDVVQVKVAANDENTGLKLTNTNVVDGSVTTKCELGLDYNMLGSSDIGKEVDEQIEAFANWCAGKTVEEVIAGTPGAGHGEAVNEELESSVTITVDAFEAALKYAYEHKTETTYRLRGQAGIAMVSGLAYNYGNPQTDISVDLAGVFAYNGKVEAALIDAVVYPLSVATDGTITPDVDDYYLDAEGGLHSKKDLGDKYAMAERNEGQPGCVLEWYEQAAIVEEAAIGCTAEEISNFVANEGDLVGATITLNNYFKALAKATNYAGKALISERLELQ